MPTVVSHKPADSPTVNLGLGARCRGSPIPIPAPIAMPRIFPACSPIEVGQRPTDARAVLLPLLRHDFFCHSCDFGWCLCGALFRVTRIVYPYQVTVIPDPIPEFMFGAGDLPFRPQVNLEQPMHLKKVSLAASHRFEFWAFPIPDPERRAVVTLVFVDVILSRVGEEVGHDKDGDIASLGIRPRKKILEVPCGNAFFVVFTVEKPLFMAPSAIYIRPLEQPFDVAPTIGWAGFLACPLTPIQVYKAKFLQQVETEAFKIGIRQAVERDLVFGFHE